MTFMSGGSQEHLNLWKQSLGNVSSTVWQQTGFESLVLADNGLTEIPGQIGGLKQLRMLDLGHNKLSRLPEEIGDLESLTDFLYLHDTKLASLPASFERLNKAAPSQHQRQSVLDPA